MISRRHIVHAHHLFGLYVAEHGDLIHRRAQERVIATAGDKVGKEAQATEVSDTGLGRFCLLFARDDGDEGDVDESHVIVADTELKLSHGLDKGRGFDISDGSAELQREDDALAETI